jgi:NAD(P)-dependent dehydrogenase (short-subunit alcohol dehydrogenase family)
MLQGKTALVTGGGRGIGRAIAEALAGSGARVVVTGRKRAELEEVAAATGGIAMVADLGERAAIGSLVERLASEVGAIDVLVNNAGIAESASLARTSDEIWDRTMAVNATAPFLLCRALVPAMVARGWGRVVNVASNAGRSGYAYTSAYCASKHALVGLTRALAVELGKTGVTVNAVCPGWVRTDMAAAAVSNIAGKTNRSAEDAERVLAAMSPQNRLMEASEVAHLVLSLCAEQARGIHGQAIVLDGGQLLA